MFRVLLSGLALLLVAAGGTAADPPKLSLLFLGGTAGHAPAPRFKQLEPVLAKRNIALTYTDKLDDLNLENLNKYDGLVIYANHPKGKPEHVKAILDYTASGKGFIPLHCASFCFTDDKDYVALVGAQFRSHTTGTFRVTDVKPDHPIMKGFGGFESWDETYVHAKHNEKDRVVLETRAEKDLQEPWTWVRTHGKGRVFYTAWGHDQRTWSHPGFQNLVERGIRWACNQDPALAGDYADKSTGKPAAAPVTVAGGPPKMTPITGKASDFEYVPAKVPFYPPTRGAKADPITTMQKPLTPEKSMTHYTMPEGFDMKLFASEEQFGGGKPICMTWDVQGRLWVALSLDYPHELKRTGPGRDKIIVLEDTDGDGKTDKVTTFAEGLSIPTSMLVARGGLIVHAAPNTLFLKDTDGDGKADVRQVLFSGWGTGDTHAGPSNLRYGFDNWVYGMVGYSGFNGTVAGERMTFRQGLYRFQVTEPKAGELKVEKLEFLRSTSNNSWGVAFNEDGDLFGSTANGCVLVHMPIANRYYEKVRGLTAGVLRQIVPDNKFRAVTDKVRQVDWHGGFTAAAGCAVYTARNYPPEYWNKTAFVSDPTGHLTATFPLTRSGTDFTAKYGWNLVAADDEWAAPIDAQVGPDGNVWVLDWYNFIVQHNPTPAGFKTGGGGAYETELRDKKYGRVYRLVYTKATAGKAPNLKDATTDDLVAALKGDNMFWRMNAQRLLVEQHDAAAVEKLTALVKDAATPEYAVVHAVWALSALAPADATRAAAGSVGHPSAVVRKNAIQALVKGWGKDADTLFGDKAFIDADAGVRLAAVLALTDLPKSTQLPTKLAADLARPNYLDDRNFADAVTIAGGSHPAPFLVGCAKLPAQSTLSSTVLSVIQRVARAFAAEAKSAASDNQTAAPTHPVETLLKAMGENPTVDAAIIDGLAQGWPAGKTFTLSPEGEKLFAGMLAKATPTARGKMMKLAATWGVKGIDAQLAELAKGLLVTVADAKAADATRLDAARQAMEYLPTDEAAANTLVAALTEKASPEFANGVLDALAASKAKTTGTALVAKLGTLPTAARPAALRLILGRADNAKAFLDAVEKGQVRFDLLDLDQKTALAAHPDADVAKRAKALLAAGGGLPDPDRQKVIEQFKGILKLTGDAGLGKKAFTQHCAKCHKHSGEGAQIGPDLTGFAVHPKEEILIAVLDPSRSVEGNYKAYTASLIDGRTIQGLLAAESKTTVELLDAENKRHAIARDDLEKLTESKKSLMPEGFEKTLTKDELTNLLEFLTQKGKYLPIPLDKVATVVTTKGMFFEPTGQAERLVFRDWKPKVFEGIPFTLVDPDGDKTKNAVMLNGPNGNVPPTMPKSVTLPCNTPAKAIHFLSGIGGWCFPASEKGTVSLIVRLQYADGTTEDHELKNGVHFADYIRRVDVPESKFAFALRQQQVRYLAVTPKRTDAAIKQIELVKGKDATAPVVMAVTVETP
ncbi:PVC-type heme-binding CxxCH protein [Limnoglobus roseus]|uniref:Putative beta-propeller-type glycoside hydrolase n=1 Tax=Limnoglobus roseus TaxID=2598579 RepID=A0A5C1AH04_9BACT|nr:PVC-type heme-binding CxxCH protein [Limnoglobus roseus]QEL16238.1 putative beta-propeller-type glycoside hydrolase [Limnoglobus roseus]